jgi:hypothetical protein
MTLSQDNVMSVFFFFSSFSLEAGDISAQLRHRKNGLLLS